MGKNLSLHNFGMARHSHVHNSLGFVYYCIISYLFNFLFHLLLLSLCFFINSYVFIIIMPALITHPWHVKVRTKDFRSLQQLKKINFNLS